MVNEDLKLSKILTRRIRECDPRECGDRQLDQRGDP
jgi:hypothetical protein